jgi:hypothetical protein
MPDTLPDGSTHRTRGPGARWASPACADTVTQEAGSRLADVPAACAATGANTLRDAATAAKADSSFMMFSMLWLAPSGARCSQYGKCLSTST